jgi:hypothetical protein
MVSISWKGSLTAAPSSPQTGWMYYNSLLGKTYVWDGSSWNIVSQDGQDGTSPEGFLITWKGGLASAPSNPQKGWAYYNTSQKKSYIWDGSSWQILAQDGQDGTGGSESGTYGPWLYVALYTPLGNYTQYNTTVMDTVNFGKVGIGSTVRSSTFYIGLIGGESTTFDLTGSPAIQVSGTDAACFTVTQPSVTSTVTGSYIMDASIAFAPTSAGTKTATITIPNNSPDKPNFSFTVTGLGSIWPKTYDGGEGDGDDAITCSVMDSQGNLYFVGYGFELVNHHSGSDWWIKKIDNNGSEVTTGWNKQINFYDNYGYSSATHDRPTNAIIDNSDNIIVSDGYNTIKWSPNGTEQWRKDIGGTLYVDSQNNIFIVTSSTITKYNTSGVLQWTKTYTGKLTFDNSNNIMIYSMSSTNNNLRYVLSDGTEMWTKTVQYSTNQNISANTWYDGVIDENNRYNLFRFNAVSGNQYTIQWNHAYEGDGSKNLYSFVSAYWESDNSSIFQNTANGYITPKTFVASKSGYVIVKVEPISSNYSGSYAIKMNMQSNLSYNFPFFINSTVLDNFGNIYIAGYSNRLINEFSKKDVWIKKYDISGNEITSGWNKIYDWGHSDDEYATKIIFDGTNIIVAGQGTDLINGASEDDGWIKKYDVNGALISEFVISDSNATLLRIDNFGNHYFSTDSSSYLRIRKYNTSGILQFTLNDKSPYIYYPSFIFDTNNNIYISGYGSNLVTSLSKNDWVIKKFNNVGVEQ